MYFFYFHQILLKKLKTNKKKQRMTTDLFFSASSSRRLDQTEKQIIKSSSDFVRHFKFTSQVIDSFTFETFALKDHQTAERQA